MHALYVSKIYCKYNVLNKNVGGFVKKMAWYIYKKNIIMFYNYNCYKFNKK